MRLFGALYARALKWARHPRAIYYLCGLSFVEAFIFPVMPEVMLMPMCVAQPRKGWRDKSNEADHADHADNEGGHGGGDSDRDETQPRDGQAKPSSPFIAQLQNGQGAQERQQGQ